MFEFSLLMIVDVPLIPVLDPLLTEDFHVIVYEPLLSCPSVNVIVEVVDDIFVGEFAFPGTISQKQNFN